MAQTVKGGRYIVDGQLVDAWRKPIVEDAASTGEAGDPQTDEAQFEEQKEDAPNATEGAIDLAKQEKIDLATVKGTGAEGRITKDDVKKAVESRDAQ